MRGNYFLFNDKITDAAMWDECQSLSGTVVYEVLRIIDGVPLFFDEHYQRLINSCKLIGQNDEPDKEKLLQQFIELAKINSFDTGNVTLKLIFDTSNELSNSGTQNLSNSLLYFIPHSYPTPEQYKEGVTVGFLEAERDNPEAKVEQGVREKANQLLKNGELYEVLLIDRDGLITEGSKSNMVFVKGSALYTCPLEKVLTGITLKKVIELAAVENIPVIYDAVSLSAIASYDALFITGTSPKILPVAKVGDVTFDVNNLLVKKLKELYDQLIDNEIADSNPLQTISR